MKHPPCPNCDGLGRLETVTSYCGAPVYSEKACDTCRGSGHLGCFACLPKRGHVAATWADEEGSGFCEEHADEWGRVA